uniref:Pheophorbide a oxygenase domain-containing protein n=1 Tax=Quercus lobata TaxID=97700 RepID=A0A7N2KLE9_QUELO
MHAFGLPIFTSNDFRNWGRARENERAHRHAVNREAPIAPSNRSTSPIDSAIDGARSTIREIARSRDRRRANHPSRDRNRRERCFVRSRRRSRSHGASSDASRDRERCFAHHRSRERCFGAVDLANGASLTVDLANGASAPSISRTVLRRRRSHRFFWVFPGSSRLIWSFPRNYGYWIYKLVPRWIFDIKQNLIIDSDLYLLHIEEHKIMDVGPANWHKACFVPTKSDALVIGFRKWLNKYAGGQVDWRGKHSGVLPPTPPREQLMDRYWSHVVNCSSCNAAYKGFNVLEVVLRVVSVASIAIAAAAKQGVISTATRTSMVLMAILFYASSRCLARFIYRNFHYHDYDHAFR